MVNIVNLRKERAAELDLAEAVVKAADDEKRALTEEEQTKFDEHMDKVDQLDETIKRAERLENAPKVDPEPEPDPKRTEPQKIEGGEDRAALQPFKSFGEQMRCVITAGQTGQIDKRLAGINERAITGLGEKVPADGGFLVQQDFSGEILKKVHETGVVASRAQVIPISAGSNGIKIPGVDESSRADGSRYGGVRAYWVDEGGSITASKPKFNAIELLLKKLAALVYLTDELVQDVTALEAFVRMAVSEELAFKVDDALFNGDGAGKPLGALQAPCVIAVAKETGQAAATVLYENIVKMWARMWGRSRQNAAWYVNQDVEPQLYTMSLAVGTGGAPVFLPPGGASGSPYATLFGRPVIPVEFCQTLGTAGDIVLADFSQYYMIRRDVQSASSIHVSFTTDQQVLRFVYRVDGEPTWKTALTPFKGSNTQSPFVSLAVRA